MLILLDTAGLLSISFEVDKPSQVTCSKKSTGLILDWIERERMDLKEAADIIRRWMGKIESKLTGRSRDLKSSSSPLWEGREKEPAPNASRSDTSTGNV